MIILAYSTKIEMDRKAIINTRKNNPSTGIRKGKAGMRTDLEIKELNGYACYTSIIS